MYLLAVVFVFSSAAAQKRILMEGFEPGMTRGLWYLIERTDALYNESSSCLTSDVKHRNGALYEIVIGYKTSAGESGQKIMSLTDDSDHPAQFFFTDQDNKQVVLSVLGTDYTNWIACHGIMSGGASAYSINSRKTTLDAQYLEAARKVMQMNEVKGPMQTMTHDNC